MVPYNTRWLRTPVFQRQVGAEYAYRHGISDLYTISFSVRRDAERKAVGFANLTL